VELRSEIFYCACCSRIVLATNQEGVCFLCDEHCAHGQCELRLIETAEVLDAVGPARPFTAS
jgi:hypothetical protein